MEFAVHCDETSEIPNWSPQWAGIWAGWFGFPIPSRVRNLSLLQNDQNYSETRIASYLVDSGLSSRGLNGRNVRLITRLPLALYFVSLCTTSWRVSVKIYFLMKLVVFVLKIRVFRPWNRKFIFHLRGKDIKYVPTLFRYLHNHSMASCSGS